MSLARPVVGVVDPLDITAPLEGGDDLGDHLAGHAELLGEIGGVAAAVA
jgi:hypothetical protein